MLQWMACVFGIVYGTIKREDEEKPWAIIAFLSLMMYFLFPVINELVLFLKGDCYKFRVQNANYSERHNLDKCIPIVYSPKYNITAFGLEKLHPFDASKYRRIYEDLVESKTIDLTTMKVHEPAVPDREFL